MVKRYLVAAWDAYYPHGGFYDVAGDFDDREQAYRFAGYLRGWRDHTDVLDLHEEPRWRGFDAYEEFMRLEEQRNA